MWSSACVCQTLIWVNNVKFSHAIPSVCVWDTWQSSTFTLLTTQREVPPCYTLCVWDTSQSSTWLHNVKFRHAVPCVSINFVCEHGPWFRCRRNFVPPWRDERLKLYIKTHLSVCMRLHIDGWDDASRFIYHAGEDLLATEYVTGPPK